MDDSISLRPAAPQDEALLYQIFASTREQELGPLGWNEADKTAFLQGQFRAQHLSYHQTYASASFDLVLWRGQPAGRLYVDRSPAEIRIIDIALLPEYRNAGIGTALIRELLEEGRRASRPVSLHVQEFSPALRLYERLGFVKREERVPYWLMEWRPPAEAPG